MKKKTITPELIMSHVVMFAHDFKCSLCGKKSYHHHVHPHISFDTSVNIADTMLLCNKHYRLFKQFKGSVTILATREQLEVLNRLNPYFS